MQGVDDVKEGTRRNVLFPHINLFLGISLSQVVQQSSLIEVHERTWREGRR